VDTRKPKITSEAPAGGEGNIPQKMISPDGGMEYSKCGEGFCFIGFRGFFPVSSSEISLTKYAFSH